MTQSSLPNLASPLIPSPSHHVPLYFILRSSHPPASYLISPSWLHFHLPSLPSYAIPYTPHMHCLFVLFLSPFLSPPFLSTVSLGCEGYSGWYYKGVNPATAGDDYDDIDIGDGTNLNGQGPTPSSSAVTIKKVDSSSSGAATDTTKSTPPPHTTISTPLLGGGVITSLFDVFSRRLLVGEGLGTFRHFRRYIVTRTVR